MEAVREVLASLRLERYAEAFENQGWDDLEYIQTLDLLALRDLARDVGMRPGHASKFLRHFGGRECSEFGDPLASETSSRADLRPVARHAAPASRHGASGADGALQEALPQWWEQDRVGSYESAGSASNLAQLDTPLSAGSLGRHVEQEVAAHGGPGCAVSRVVVHSPRGSDGSGSSHPRTAREDTLYSPGSEGRTGPLDHLDRTAQATVVSISGLASRNQRGSGGSRASSFTLSEGRPDVDCLDGDLGQHSGGDPMSTQMSVSSLTAMLPSGKVLDENTGYLSDWLKSHFGSRWGKEAIDEAQAHAPITGDCSTHCARGSGRCIETSPREFRRENAWDPEEEVTRQPHLLGYTAHDFDAPEPSAEDFPRVTSAEQGPPQGTAASWRPRAMSEWASALQHGELHGGAPSAGGEFQRYWYMALLPSEGCCGELQEAAQRRGPGWGSRPVLGSWWLLAGVVVAALALVGLAGAACAGQLRSTQSGRCCTDPRARCLACQRGVSVASYCGALNRSDAEKRQVGCNDVCSESAEGSITDAQEVEDVLNQDDCCEACTIDTDCISWHFGYVPDSPYKLKYLNGHMPRCWARRRSTTGGTHDRGRAHTLFCFSIMPPCSANTDLLRMQVDLNYSIFGCDAFAVYSDTAADLGRGVTAEIFSLDLSCPDGDELVGASVYKELWTHVATEGRYDRFDWTVMVDTDSVFFPDRLRLALASVGRRRPGQPLVKHRLDAKVASFLSSSEQELRGHLVVLSSEAVKMLAEGQDTCSMPDDESAYLQSCLQEVGASQISDRDDLLASEACHTEGWAQCQSSHVAFARFVNEVDYKACVVEAAKAEGGRRLSQTLVALP